MQSTRVVTPVFVTLVASALCNFVAMGMVAPVLPRHIEDDLGGGPLHVGIVVGAYAVAAAASRPAIGALGDRRGRRPLIVGGMVVAALSILGYGAAPVIVALVAMRFVTGLGEAAVFVGTHTAAQDLGPPHRRGEAATFFSISVWGGMAIGPPLGDLLSTTVGPGAVWPAAAAVVALGSAIGLLLPRELGRHPVEVAAAPAAPRAGRPAAVHWRHRLMHPAATWPGFMLFCNLTSSNGFSAFIPLVAHDRGGRAGPLLFLYAATVLSTRLAWRRWPDRAGPARVATVSLALTATAGLLLAWAPTYGALFAGTFVLGLGAAFLMPTMLTVTVARAPDGERSRAMSSASLWLDMSQGLGAPLLGLVAVAAGTEQAAFAAAAVLALAGLVVGRTRLEPEPEPGARPAAAGAGA